MNRKLHCCTTQKHSVYWINESSGWRCSKDVFQISFDLCARTAQDSRLPYLDLGGGTQSSPLCKVTSINYSDTLTESRNLHYFGFKWLVWHFDECREIPLWSGNRGCRSETETLREHKRVFPKMSNSSCVRNSATMWNVRLLSDAPCLTLRLKQQYTLAGAAVKDQTSLI